MTESPAFDVRWLLKNAWNWDFKRFLRETGLYDDEYGRAKWRAFQDASDILRQFDDRLLRLLTAPPPAATSGS